MRGTAPLARIVAFVALVAAAAFIAVMLLGGSNSGYEVKARFENASQLVKGNLVQVSGMPAGKVEDIRLTDDGQAELTLSIDDKYAPLRRGTLATVRQASLSGVANRYVDLRLPDGRAPALEDGATLDQESTTTAVDLDEIFNTLDEPTRKDLQNVIQGSAAQHKNRGAQMNEGLLYLNPSLSSSSRLFRELNADSKLLERFVVASSQLVTDLADRRDDLAGLVDNLATTTNAIGSEQQAVAESVGRLPDFMRRANTTFLNLRATLDDLEPLVDDSKPVAKKLRPFLAELRPLAQDARPTFRDLSELLKAPGDANDLIDLTNLQPPLRDVAVRDVEENGKDRAGRVPGLHRGIREGRAAGRLHPAVHRRPARLVRRLQPLRHVRRARGRLARGHPRQRVRGRRRPARAGAAGAARRGLQPHGQDRPAQPLPGRRRAPVRGRLAALEAVA